VLLLLLIAKLLSWKFCVGGVTGLGVSLFLQAVIIVSKKRDIKIFMRIMPAALKAMRKKEAAM
jgi:hypothetical protein